MPFKCYLREHRLKLGLTQDELARELGVTRQTIIALEKEKYAPSMEVAMGIGEIFRLPIEQIFQDLERELDSWVSPAINPSTPLRTSIREEEKEIIVEVSLPQRINPKKVKAELKEGVLTIRLPKVK